MAARPWVVIQHVAHEGPGAIGAAVADAGFELIVARVDRGDPIPSPSVAADIAGLVVMGGPMSANDDLAWLASEREFLRAAHEVGRPVLGVCLGAQQLAAALGARVVRGPEPEIGVGEVHLSREAVDDPVLGPAPSPLPCVHWHGETFTLPTGALHLARSADYANQAFRAGPCSYGLQFHVEVTAGLVGGWGPHLPPGVCIRASDVARMSRAGMGVLRRFVALSDSA